MGFESHNSNTTFNYCGKKEGLKGMVNWWNDISLLEPKIKWDFLFTFVGILENKNEDPVSIRMKAMRKAMEFNQPSSRVSPCSKFTKNQQRESQQLLETSKA